MIIVMITIRKSYTNSQELWVGAYLSCREKNALEVFHKTGCKNFGLIWNLYHVF